MIYNKCVSKVYIKGYMVTAVTVTILQTLVVLRLYRFTEQRVKSIHYTL